MEKGYINHLGIIAGALFLLMPVSSLQVRQASDAAPPRTLPPGSHFVEFLSFDVIAEGDDIPIQKITVTSNSLGSQNALSNICMTDPHFGFPFGELILGCADSLGTPAGTGYSTDIVFNPPLLIAAGTIHRYRVRADINGAAHGAIRLDLVGITVPPPTMLSGLPILGNEVTFTSNSSVIECELPAPPPGYHWEGTQPFPECGGYLVLNPGDDPTN